MKTTLMVGNCKQRVINNTKRIRTTAKRTHNTFFSFSDFSLYYYLPYISFFQTSHLVKLLLIHLNNLFYRKKSLFDV